MKLRYTKAERIRKAAAEALLTDPIASPADKAAALRELRYLETAALRRRDRAEEWYPPAPPAEPPSVDELVRQLEKGATVPVPSVPGPLQPVQTVQDSPTGQNVQDSQNDPKPAEVLAIADGTKPQPVLEPQPAPKCRHCHAPAPDPHMFWPIAGPSLDRQRLCPDCFRTMCSLCARNAPTPPADPAPMADFATLLGIQGRVAEQNFAKSQEIWMEQDRQERASAEAQRRRQEADRLSGNFGWVDGGKL
jgi:hypothetical protein